MRLETQIIMALLLDLALGDPRWLPHPVRLIAALAVRLENLTVRLGLPRTPAGLLTVCAVLLIIGTAGWGLVRLAGLVHPLAGDAASILLLYTCFAARDMVAHSNRVYRALAAGDLAGARNRVAMIVGRDTDVLDEAGVVRATVESVAENTVDGITAPLFWAVIGGPVGALLYKAINTMDSMFGYRNEKYLYFGWAAARLDDLANWLPARLTGLLMVPGASLLGLRGRDAWRILLRDHGNHSSPNSALAEAPMAGALGIRLGGPTRYQGSITDYPAMWDSLASPAPGHIRAANRLLVVTVLLATGFLVLVRMICGAPQPLLFL